MKKTRIIFYVLFISLIILVISGCSNNYHEINKVIIVDGIGIDKVNDKYIVSFNTYVENDKYEVINITVDNLEEAFEDIYLSANKKIYLSHLNILLLSSNLENSDIILILNTFNNRYDLRGSFLVSLVNNYNKDVLASSSLEIVNLINNNYLISGDVYPSTFNEIIDDYLSLGISYIPVLDNDLSIIGMHSILAEYRFYNLNEAKYLNLIHNKLNSFNFNIDNDEIKIDSAYLCYEVNNGNINIKLYLSYMSNVSEKNIKKYLEDNIYSLLDLDINNYYFIDLVKRKDYSYYLENEDFDISISLDISLNKDGTNNIKEDDIIEKNK